MATYLEIKYKTKVWVEYWKIISTKVKYFKNTKIYYSKQLGKDWACLI